MAGKKKFSLLSMLGTVVCVVLVCEAAAPVAAIGNSQFFWWILLTFIFLLPYGLIASELGTAYPSEGGIYDWVKQSFGRRMAAGVAWYYWINYPIWMASLAIIAPVLVQYMFGIELPFIVTMVIELAFIWVVTFVSMSPVSESAWVLNVSAIAKIVISLGLGVIGIVCCIQNGFANDMSPASFLPSGGIEGLANLPVVLFNFLGFEIVCTFVNDMENPKKQIPQAIIAGGLLIAAIYMFSSFGIGVAIPVDQISASSGIVDAVVAMTGSSRNALVIISAGLFFIAIVGNMVSGAMGVNNVVAYAAEDGSMPKVYAQRNKKGVPMSCAIINAVVGSAIVIIAPFIPNQDMFWAFFKLNLFAFLVSYLPIFPAFLKLRKEDPDTPRPYRVPGGDLALKVMAWLPFVQILICIFFTVVPLGFDPESLSQTLPITIGAVLIVIINEVYLRVAKVK